MLSRKSFKKINVALNYRIEKYANVLNVNLSSFEFNYHGNRLSLPYQFFQRRNYYAFIINVAFVFFSIYVQSIILTSVYRYVRNFVTHGLDIFCGSFQINVFHIRGS